MLLRWNEHLRFQKRRAVVVKIKGKTMTIGQQIAQKLQENWNLEENIVSLSNLAFQLSQDYAREISEELYDRLFDLILIQEGTEFEMSEEEIREVAFIT